MRRFNRAVLAAVTLSTAAGLSAVPAAAHERPPRALGIDNCTATACHFDVALRIWPENPASTTSRKYF